MCSIGISHNSGLFSARVWPDKVNRAGGHVRLEDVIAAVLKGLWVVNKHRSLESLRKLKLSIIAQLKLWRYENIELFNQNTKNNKCPRRVSKKFFHKSVSARSETWVSKSHNTCFGPTLDFGVVPDYEQNNTLFSLDFLKKKFSFHKKFQVLGVYSWLTCLYKVMFGLW